MIRLSPSSFNIQPWKVKVVTDQATKEMLRAASWDQPQIDTCSHLLVFCADTDLDRSGTRLESMMREAGVEKRRVDGYLQMMRGYITAMDERAKLHFAQRETFIALGNAVNGAKALGFDSCPMGGFDPKRYGEILSLPPNLVPTAVCPVGYPADKMEPKLRFAQDEVFF